MKRFYESKTFSRTLRQWYKKLQKSGFEDAEYLDSNLEATNYFRTVGNTLGRSSGEPSVRWDVLEYYQICTHWLHHMDSCNLDRFTDKKISVALIKKVWALHCDGLTYSRIYTTINGKKKTVGLKKLKKLIKTLEAEAFSWHKYEDIF